MWAESEVSGVQAGWSGWFYIALIFSLVAHYWILVGVPDRRGPSVIGGAMTAPLAVSVSIAMKAVQSATEPVEIKRDVKTLADKFQPVSKPVERAIREAKAVKEKIKEQSVQAQAESKAQAQSRQEDLPPSEIPVVSEVGYRQPPQPPVYPRLALRKRQQGVVWVRALVSAAGETREVKIERSSGYVMLDRSALDAVKKWVFDAAQVNGKLVTAWVEVPVEFSINR